MVVLSGVGSINQALNLISSELKLIKEKAKKAKLSNDQRDKITDTDLKSFIQTLGGRLALLDQKTNDLLKFFNPAKESGTNPQLSENPDYSTTDSWGTEILRLVKDLREEQVFQAGSESLPKWISPDDRDLAGEDERNIQNIFAKMLENIEQHIKQERYKIKIDKIDTQKNA